MRSRPKAHLYYATRLRIKENVARRLAGGTRSERLVDYETRSFAIDILACPHCGGQLRLLATIKHRAAIVEILSPAHRGPSRVDPGALYPPELTERPLLGPGMPADSDYPHLRFGVGMPAPSRAIEGWSRFAQARTC